jgi:UDP:flavonoid glycosyltransferase YjiC (YdhE family)
VHGDARCHGWDVPLISFAAIPAFGHLYPLLPLAEACKRAGSEVSVATGAPFLDALPLPTAVGIEGGVGIDDVIGETFRRYPSLDGAMQFLAAFFGDVNPRTTIPMLRRTWQERRPDLVVREGLNAGPAVVAAELGIPVVSFGIVQWWPIHAGLVGAAREAVTRAEDTPAPWELAEAAVADGLATMTLVDPIPLSFPRRGEQPVDVLPIRPDGWSDPRVPLPELPASGRPLVYLTLGTVSYGAVEVLRRAIEEVAPLDVDVVVGAGPEADLSLLGDLPANVHAHRYLPQAALLPQTSVIVHHGGMGTTLSAAAVGVPQLLLPQGADQAINAHTATEVGFGRALEGDDQQVPGAIAGAVTALLANGPERRAAAELAAEIVAMPSPDDVAAQLLARL